MAKRPGEPAPPAARKSMIAALDAVKHYRKPNLPTIAANLYFPPKKR
ncbi:MAG: hypothetical protein ABR985_00845 [Methanotrichaceae archaeon]